MICKVAINALVLRRTKSFIDRRHRREHRWRHNKRHLKQLWKRHRFLRRITKRKKSSEIEKWWILRRVTKRNLRWILFRFRIFSFIEKRHAIHQIVDVYDHFFHDLRKIVQSCINFWWKFSSLLDDAQQIRRTITNIFFENRLHLLHKNRRSLCFVLSLSDHKNCALQTNETKRLINQIFKLHLFFVVFVERIAYCQLLIKLFRKILQKSDTF
jgi:hypothetical protein